MRNSSFKNRNGQTPVTIEQLKGLIPAGVATMGDLDEHEELNITQGLSWLQNTKEEHRKHFFWLKLHKKLFNNVWSWAGKTRNVELENQDFVESYKILPEFRKLEGDLSFWLDKSPIDKKESAAMFHVRIETIHPFNNGNGRLGRILTEHICRREEIAIPTWSASEKTNPEARRVEYISSLVEARRNQNHKSLIQFMFKP